MEHQPPELKNRQSWIVVGLLVAIVGVVPYVYAASERESEPYIIAMKRARSDPRVVAALGTPIEEGAFQSMYVVKGTSMPTSKFTLTIRGPKQKATFSVNARKIVKKTKDGPHFEWRFYELMVSPANGPAIDLTTPPAPAK
jgi:hypothetical protein